MMNQEASDPFSGLVLEFLGVHGTKHPKKVGRRVRWGIRRRQRRVTEAELAPILRHIIYLEKAQPLQSLTASMLTKAVDETGQLATLVVFLEISLRVARKRRETLLEARLFDLRRAALGAMAAHGWKESPGNRREDDGHLEE